MKALNSESTAAEPCPTESAGTYESDAAMAQALADEQEAGGGRALRAARRAVVPESGRATRSKPQATGYRSRLRNPSATATPTGSGSSASDSEGDDEDDEDAVGADEVAEYEAVRGFAGD